MAFPHKNYLSQPDRFCPTVTENAISRYQVQQRTQGFQHTPNTYDRRLNYALQNDFQRPILNFGGRSPRVLTPKASPKWTVKAGELQPLKCLDLPDACDNFYLNVLDWSSKDLLAVGLRSGVYLYDVGSSVASEVFDWCERNDGVQNGTTFVRNWVVRALKWNRSGMVLAVGYGQETEISPAPRDPAKRGVLLDPNAKGMVKHEISIANDPSAFAWKQSSSSELTCATVCGDVTHQDFRQRGPALSIDNCHAGSVVALAWNQDDNTLATGGNDNFLQLWDVRRFNVPLTSVEGHASAIKV